MPENPNIVRGGRGNTPLLHFNWGTVNDVTLVSTETGEPIANLGNVNINNEPISSGGVVTRQTFYSNSGTGTITTTMPNDILSAITSYMAADSFSNPNKTYIQRYDYIPSNFIFHPAVESPTQLFLGVELEIDVGGKSEEIARQIIDNLGEDNVYCKSDSSVRQGFEIVTHPCTFAYHQTLPYERVFETLIKQGYHSHDVGTCGLHVHFNRNFFGEDKLIQDLNISKLLYIIEKYWAQVVMIARRDSNTYAKRFFINGNESPLDIYVKARNTNKYGVINLQHKDTIEIRIFKGTLKYNSFISTLEFVNTLIPIIRDIDIYEIQKLNWEGISSHFSENLKTYIKEREALKEDLLNSTPSNSNNSSVPEGYYGQYRGIRATVIDEDLRPENIRHGMRFSGVLPDQSQTRIQSTIDSIDTVASIPNDSSQRPVRIAMEGSISSASASAAATAVSMGQLVDRVQDINSNTPWVISGVDVSNSSQPAVYYNGTATRVWDEFSSSWQTAVSSAAANSIQSPTSEIEQLQQQRRELELQLERTHNPLRKIQIRREISNVTSKIGRLRAAS